MKQLAKLYFSSSLLMRIFIGFLAGSAIGCAMWLLGTPEQTTNALQYIKPFGDLLVSLLKMIVVPVICLSLIVGAASLPIQRFGKVGLKVISWYLLCSFLAAAVGALMATAFNPGSEAALQAWESIASSSQVQEAAQLKAAQAETKQGGILSILLGMFENPFSALSNGNFLAIITFSILFGLALRVLLENSNDKQQKSALNKLMDIISAGRDIIFKLVDWILEYTPIGVFALSIANFSAYGPKIAGPYVEVTLGVIAGVLVMVFIAYPLLLAVVTKRNPIPVMKIMQEAIITAFITRSSAATLPVSIRVAEDDLKVKNELASFSLPLGATINMDGVCVHLPMFAILAANMFSLDLGFSALVVLVITTVLASIGAGGVPGGSLMLLFIILQAMGLDPTQISIIVALALGINPILDMFETANNVTGDLVCTYAVASTSDLIDKSA
ncbi:dicarboxylate/amino acid:cation symporter [Spartinivicinus poritis]|uniref:Dicarboxylate/amino acid:cation symporter n=1 Tax=Spartinivicinus poritis TaxID=2994640 RepID=A0ABT5U2K1_9GAMM|nr:dicarboxylate/amino acid:cation symporter [Spartinivicinus sp. A2-2]MDE1460597.1 dicarboxylate/amino acid:cation symporter [Spartinivicinus sp. A2-2]